jgi:uncharacterized protein (DUF433 family)
MYDNGGMDKLVNWGEYITADPEILAGKATIRGTRISVELILELIANGWTFDQILESYPHLTRDQIAAVLAYTIEVVRDDHLMPLAAKST